jgi:hypothetical protein
MESRSGGDNQDLEDWAALHASLLPWSDDQTTATYETAQLGYLQSYLHTETSPPVPEPDDEQLWTDTSSGWDAAPLIVEVSEPAQRMPAPRSFPRAYVDSPARRDDTGRRAHYDPAADENPFARPHGGLGAWLQLMLACTGLFGSVLFGLLLSRASHALVPAQNSVVQHTAAAPLPAAPESLPVAPPPPAQAEPALARVAAPAPVRQPPVRSVTPESNLPVRHDSPARSRVPPAQHARVARDNTPAVREPSPAVSPRVNTSVAPGAAAASSVLRINSRPWSQVFVDGRFIGVTPQLDIRVPAGTHNVRLVNPEFGMRKAFTVRVALGETVTRVETLEE